MDAKLCFSNNANSARRDFTLTDAGTMALLYREHPAWFPFDCPNPYANVNDAAKDFAEWVRNNPTRLPSIP